MLVRPRAVSMAAEMVEAAPCAQYWYYSRSTGIIGLNDELRRKRRVG